MLCSLLPRERGAQRAVFVLAAAFQGQTLVTACPAAAVVPGTARLERRNPKANRRSGWGWRCGRQVAGPSLVFILSYSSRGSRQDSSMVSSLLCRFPPFSLIPTIGTAVIERMSDAIQSLNAEKHVSEVLTQMTTRS